MKNQIVLLVVSLVLMTCEHGRKIDSTHIYKEALSYINSQRTQTVSITHWDRIFNDFDLNPEQFTSQQTIFSELEYPFDVFLNEFPDNKSKELLGLTYDNVSWEANTQGLILFRLKNPLDTTIFTTFAKRLGYIQKQYKKYTYYNIMKSAYYEHELIKEEELTTLQLFNLCYLPEQQLFLIARAERELKQQVDFIYNGGKNRFAQDDFINLLEENYSVYFSTVPIRYPNLGLSLMNLTTRAIAEDTQQYKAFVEDVLGVTLAQLETLHTYQVYAMGLARQDVLQASIILQYAKEEDAKADFPVRLQMEQNGLSFYDASPLAQRYPLDRSKTFQKGRCIALVSTPKQSVINRLIIPDLLSIQVLN